MRRVLGYTASCAEWSRPGTRRDGNHGIREVELDVFRKRQRAEDMEAEHTALCAEFRPVLQRFFSKRVKERHEVDDLVQDVFVRLVRKLNADDEARVAAGYVFQTAQSVLNDWLRKRQSHRSAAHDELEADLPDVADASPERVLAGQQSLSKATAAVLELPEITRTIFLLRRLEGMRYQDISKRLRMPISTIEKHMARAVAHLDSRLHGGR